MLLSVLPFKAPSVSPLVLTHQAPQSAETFGPAFEAKGKVASAPMNLKPGKKPHRQTWLSNLDVAAGNAYAPERESRGELSPTDLSPAFQPRPPPGYRLRAPPQFG